MKSLNRFFVLSTLLILFTQGGYAAEEAAKPGMDPAVMEKMKVFTSPTEAHKTLEPFAGKWTYTGKFWMAPDAQPQEMAGISEQTMIYGGRFLKQEIEGPWMGETFNGTDYIGYDNVKEEYVSAWIDSVGTGIMTSSGQYDAATKTLKLSGANSCPLTGEKAREGRSEWTLTDNDHNVYTSYLAGPDGKEFKAMEINYTRAAV